jgi:hypothetical protein
LRLLGELRDINYIAPIINAGIPTAPDKISEQRGVIWDGEVPQVIARCGTVALAPTLALLDDEHTSNVGHHRAAIALAYLTVEVPELDSEIIAALEARLTTSDVDRNASVALPWPIWAPKKATKW